MTNVISLCQEHGIRRIISCSAWGVAETKKDLPKWFAWFIDNSNIGVAYADHERQERLLNKSNLNWTIVRPSGLTNTKSPQTARETFDHAPKPSLTISRQSVAEYLVKATENDSLFEKAVVISKD